MHKRISDFLEAFEKEKEIELKKKLLELLNSEKEMEKEMEKEKEHIKKEDFELVKNAIYFNHHQKVPNLDWFKSLDDSQLKILLEEDRKYGYIMKLVYRACIQYNNPTELVIYLIEKGFVPTVWETGEIIKNGNLELIKHYAKNPLLKEQWNLYTGLCEAIKIDREDIFNFLIQNKVFTSEERHKKCALEGAVNICFEKSSIKFLNILLNTFPSILMRYVREIYDNQMSWVYVFRPTPSNQFLLWLWNNDLKWTRDQAEKIGIPFMFSFFN